MHEGGISIWFFIGICLGIMGVLIFGAGIWQLVLPPPPDQRVVLYQLHAPIWWGALLAALGAFYCFHFRPGKTSASH